MSNILYVYSGKARQNAGGLDLVVRQELQALVEAGHKITFLSRGVYSNKNVTNIPIKITPANLLSHLKSHYYYCAQHRFFSMVGSWFLHMEKFDLVIGWLQQSRSLFRTANKLGVPCALNCVVHYRLPSGDDSDNYVWPYTNFAYRNEEYHRASILLVPSEFSKKTFVENGFPENKVAVVGRGADVKKFYPDFNLTRPFRVCFFGRACHRKGILQALESWKCANLEHGEFWIIGDVDEEVADEIKRYKKNLKNIYLKGFSKNPEELLRQCHVQILPTFHEGMAKTLVEGAACGLVTISTPESGFPIIQGDTGFYCERHAIQNMSELIIFLANNPEELQKMARISTEFVHKNLTWDKFRTRFKYEIKKQLKQVQSLLSG
jgi:glycosyltransferase involved in cell wall biosynthesis